MDKFTRLGRNFILPGDYTTVLFKKDDESALQFFINRLLVKIPKSLNDFIDIEIIKGQLQNAGWCIVENVQDLISVWLEKEKFPIEELKNYTHSLNQNKTISDDFIGFLSETKILCLWPQAGISENYIYQMKFAGMLTQIDFKQMLIDLKIDSISLGNDDFIKIAHYIIDRNSNELSEKEQKELRRAVKNYTLNSSIDVHRQI